jgi:hypothetical protein
MAEQVKPEKANEIRPQASEEAGQGDEPVLDLQDGRTPEVEAHLRNDLYSIDPTTDATTAAL